MTQKEENVAVDGEYDQESRQELRGAVYRADGATLVRILDREDWPGHSLQLIGEGLLAVLDGPTTDAGALATRCADALRERDLAGDGELADALEAALGTGPVPMLRPLPVDLEELAGVLEGDPVMGGGRIDLQTGEVWPQSAIEYGQETGEFGDLDDLDEDRWLQVACRGSRPGYRDMESFISALDDPDRADRLSIAINGRGAFRRFKDVLSRWPELFDRWFAFSADRQRGRARAWLADEGYAAVSRRDQG